MSSQTVNNPGLALYNGVLASGAITTVLFERYTRGSHVVAMDSKRAYLKDTWRIDLPSIVKEGLVYDKLDAAHVPHIAHVIAYGDAKGNWQKTTVPDRFSGKTDVHRRHYSIVLCQIGKAVESFGTIWEVVNAMKCAIKAHDEAFRKAKILHRDISVGNILISEDGTEGFLIDWDSSKSVADNETPERIGTWQFMSARLLLGRDDGPHTHVDDLESFFHVLCWVVLRVGHYSIGVKEAIEHLKAVYDYAVIYEGKTSGGTHKEARLMAYWMTRVAKVSNKCLRDLVADFEELVAVRYIKGPSVEDRRQYERLLSLPGLVLDDPLITRDVVWKYDKHLERLEDSSWIYERFCKAVDPSKLGDVPNSKNLQIIQSELLKVFGAPADPTKRHATDDISSEHRSRKSKRDSNIFM